MWRPRGERLNPAFALRRHTAPTAEVMIWGDITYNTRLSPALIHDIMTAQRSFFQQDNARPYMARVSQDSLRVVTTIPWPPLSPDLYLIEHIWDHLGRRVGHLMSLNELKARLQQMWNEMSQDIIQNLYASMPDL
ncbi:transposable element Tcb2 transposase [Trichonephila clavipes]|uniref:Transposable element Tcb2 transposase n=1 Tax=Trichonephila clavipes TaxID=2585209 RepID=A0A8X6VXN4_TRICX|nr:transposable element Tcb2 transposase [Trichonephila clavipes]